MSKITKEKEKILAILKLLSSFEEEMAEYYQAISGIYSQHEDFWSSASMMKSTRANLYSNLIQDFSNNSDNYQLKHDLNGPFINLYNKLKAEKSRLSLESINAENNNRFICEIETASTKTRVVPEVTGNTETFSKIVLILDQTQARQVRLIEGYIESQKKTKSSTA
ncbi:MAG: hypothetical protein KAR42_04905 [candidate division Zixibacteria bacterium]|nr:hypothetical protein [candidate division Zixibacteria bacterium]